MLKAIIDTRSLTPANTKSTLDASSPVIATFLHNYSDCVDDTVRQSLKPFISRLVNSRGTAAVEEQRSMLALDWLIRVHTAEWLKAANFTQHADTLAKAARLQTAQDTKNVLPTLVAARASAKDAARAVARDAARDAAKDAAKDAAWDAARDAVRASAGAAAWVAAGDAAWAAAGGVAWATAWDAARAAAGDAARDALKPTVLLVQATVPDLLDRMLALTEGGFAQ